LAGVAIAVRAMEKFAVLGVDSVGIAHSERAAGTNRDAPNLVAALRPAAFEKQATLLAARHDRPLALIEDAYRQFRLLNYALMGCPCGQSPLGNVANRRSTRYLSRVCCLAFERSELKDAFGRRS
jgi:hypothetical protein